VTPCDHARHRQTAEGNAECADCGAVAIWPDDPDAECELDDCDWPTCMARDCDGPLGDGVPPEWITFCVAVIERAMERNRRLREASLRAFDAAGEGLSAPAEDDREDDGGDEPSAGPGSSEGRA